MSLLLDVNVLVYAHREDVPDHHAWRSWLEDALSGDEAILVPDAVFVGFMRVVTLPAWKVPSLLEEALRFVAALRMSPVHEICRPGLRTWSGFTRVLQEAGATANRVPDAWLAALAIEHGATLITADAGFARFPGLAWKHPLNGRGS